MVTTSSRIIKQLQDENKRLRAEAVGYRLAIRTLVTQLVKAGLPIVTLEKLTKRQEVRRVQS